MRKIAIITLNGYFNYGNRLQNYALQTFLESLGFEVETIRLNKNGRSERIKSWLRPVKYKLAGKSIELSRQKVFKQFSKKFISETNKTYNINDDLSELSNRYDYFVIGSDQVWNPSMNKTSTAYFADFAPQEKVISYAASFGISELSPNVEEIYKKGLLNLKGISVREEDGKHLVKKLVNKESEVLVDPTLLLTEEQWLKIATPIPNNIDKPYLLTYFLGGIPKKYEDFIEKIRNDNDLEIINLGDPQDEETYATGPSEFLTYIKNSQIFLTDSFHGSVFSIIFDKPFVVFERVGSKSMFSRLKTLLKLFKLQDRIYSEDFEGSKLMCTPGNDQVRILKLETEKSIDFITRNLSK